MKKRNIIVSFLLFMCLVGCTHMSTADININLQRATQTLNAIYKYYSVDDSNLLRETYPFDQNQSATYLASENQVNKYSYLWPYSGTLSAVNAILAADREILSYDSILTEQVLPGLEEYFDTKRTPYAYASYINSAPQSDRFYDDNVWLGIDFTDLYIMTNRTEYLEKAKLIWSFILSGMDEQLGGGIYWCEQNKGSKNTCSNAPGAVYALKLYQATGDSVYFEYGKDLYNWTKVHLQDTDDYLYFDNINLEGKVDKAKYPYNSGQMLQAAALLYQLTEDQNYLLDAQNIAQSGYNYFFTDHSSFGSSCRLLKNSDIWFIGVMLRGYIELYTIDNNRIYLDSFQKSLDYAWENMRDNNGLFNKDWSNTNKDEKKWLLTQAAFVEMYARLAQIN